MDVFPKLIEDILSLCPHGVIGSNREGDIFLFNPGAERILGYPRDEAIGKMNVSLLFPTGKAPQGPEFLPSGEFADRGRIQNVATEFAGRDGRRIPVRLSATEIGKEGGKEGILWFFNHLSSGRTVPDDLLEVEGTFRSIVESARDAIISIDEDWKILLANPAVKEMLGYDPGELIGKDIRRLLPPRYAGNWDLIRSYTTPKETTEEETRYVEVSALGKSGKEIPVHVSISESLTHGKRMFNAILRDISERKVREEKLRLLSITDGLTGLFNRRHFYSLAQKDLERALRNKGPFSILLIDIDDFKRINDAYGHHAGDSLLKEVADLMRKTFRLMDTCFRFGGEEFLVLLPDTNAENAIVAAERFRSRLAGKKFHPAPLRPPLTVTASIGVSEYREGWTVDDIVRCADLAMYAAKHGGRNRTVNYGQLESRPIANDGAA
jgi:diguanylate cyclase (GGDEF)-like protein/PAS domain S-box-containing protein